MVDDGPIYDADRLALEDEIAALKKQLYDLECRHDRVTYRVRHPLTAIERSAHWEQIEALKYRVSEVEQQLRASEERVVVLEGQLRERADKLTELNTALQRAKNELRDLAPDAMREKIKRDRAEWARHHQEFTKRIADLKFALRSTDYGKLAYDNLCKQQRLERVLDILERSETLEEARDHIRALIRLNGGNDGKRDSKTQEEPQLGGGGDSQTEA